MADKKLVDIMTRLRQAGDYFLNSDYGLLWSGRYAGRLNNWNSYVENITVPGKTIQTNDSRTANSLVAKIAGDITFEDMEITWRLEDNLDLYFALNEWVAAAKGIDDFGVITTGYWDDYCRYNNLLVSGGASSKPMFLIDGLYPTSIQSIQFSAEGGEYVKLTTTFSCYHVRSPQ